MAEENRTASQAQPAEAAYADKAAPAKLGREGYGESLAATVGRPANEAAEWLAKMMPAKTVMGVQLSGLGMLDPTKKSQFDEFTTKDDFAASRRRLASRLAQWIELLSSVEDSSEALEKLDEAIQSTEALYERNLKSALETVRPLEQTYRMLDAFYANAQQKPGDKVDCWIYNATPSKLMDPDDRTNYEQLAKQIQREYLSFSMRKNYGLLVVPGWLGDVKKIDRLGTLAFQNKLTAITDGPDRDSAEKLLEYMQSDAFAALMGTEKHKRNITLTCNYLLARPKNKVEDEEMFVPPSAHLAGTIYRNDLTDGIHQASAGFTHGKMLNAEGVRFHVDRPTATQLMTKHGLNAIVDWDGYPRVVGDQNLSHEEGYNTYAKVRTEDWIVKNVVNFLNYQAFKAITADNLSSWRAAIYKFLDSISDRQGKKIILGFDIDVEASDEERRKNMVRVNLGVKYAYGVRYFNLRVKEQDNQKTVENA